jgi:MATE family multidrug resistance protein
MAFALGLLTPMGGAGVWVGLAVGLTVAAIFLILRWHGRERYGLLPAAITPSRS